MVINTWWFSFKNGFLCGFKNKRTAITKNVVLKKVLLFILFSVINNIVFAQNTYKTVYKRAVFMELFGSSPFASFNYEIVPTISEKSFSSFRMGLGYVPGSTKPNADGKYDNGISFPVGISHNFVINNLKKRFRARVSAKCNPHPPRFSIESFGEVGIVFTPVVSTVSNPRNYTFGVLGLRNQIVFGEPARQHVAYLKIQYTPFFHQKKLWLASSPGSIFLFGVTAGYSLK